MIKKFNYKIYRCSSVALRSQKVWMGDMDMHMTWFGLEKPLKLFVSNRIRPIVLIMGGTVAIRSPLEFV